MSIYNTLQDAKYNMKCTLMHDYRRARDTTPFTVSIEGQDDLSVIPEDLTAYERVSILFEDVETVGIKGESDVRYVDSVQLKSIIKQYVLRCVALWTRKEQPTDLIGGSEDIDEVESYVWSENA